MGKTPVAKVIFVVLLAVYFGGALWQYVVLSLTLMGEYQSAPWFLRAMVALLWPLELLR